MSVGFKRLVEVRETTSHKGGGTPMSLRELQIALAFYQAGVSDMAGEMLEPHRELLNQATNEMEELENDRK